MQYNTTYYTTKYNSLQSSIRNSN